MRQPFDMEGFRHAAEELRNAGRALESAYIDEAAVEIERLQAAVTWRPIETAPEDGTNFLARQRVVMDERDEDNNIIRRGVVEYFTYVAYWFGGMIVEAPWRGGICTNATWTHWMPLPAGPEGAQP